MLCARRKGFTRDQPSAAFLRSGSMMSIDTPRTVRPLFLYHQGQSDECGSSALTSAFRRPEIRDHRLSAEVRKPHGLVPRVSEAE